jgi:L-2-hydroxyglutarate oxidase
VLAGARERYRRAAFDPRDVAALVRDPGLRRLARRHARTGAAEVVRSLSRRRFARAVQRLVPEVVAADLVPATPGIRAQALTPAGALVDDFLLVEGPASLHVCNAPSPAATASLEIGRVVAERVVARLGGGPPV